MQLECPNCHETLHTVGPGSTENCCPGCGVRFGPDTAATAIDDAAGGRRIAHFELVQMLGSGSYGVVWKALDTKLDRLVAIKLSHNGGASRKQNDSLMREARSAAQLKHPNVVAIHEVGSDGDTNFIVSDYVQGATLADLLQENRFDIRETVELCLKLANGVAHAHGAHVIHRDLKPSNIIIDGIREPHIVDFGLAKREANEATQTLQGQILGTPHYMSPEQASGESHAADSRSDIYALGVILYELMTGERPFRGTAQAVLYQVLYENVVPPRRLNHAIPRDLEAICLKAMEREPQRRYSSAENLADDLRRFLTGERVKARPGGRIAQAWRWCRRIERVRDAGACMCFIAVLLFTWAMYGLVYVGTSGTATDRSNALLFLIVFANVYVMYFLIGLGTLRRHVVALYLGLVAGMTTMISMLLVLMDLIPFSMGGVYSDVERRVPLFSLLVLLAVIITSMYAIALVAYYSNTQTIRWRATKPAASGEEMQAVRHPPAVEQK